MNNATTENAILQVPIEDIIPNRFQPRLSFDDASLQDLAASIKQHGIIQPLVLRRVNDKYEIIAGERRYKAAKMAGLVSVPAIISDMDDNTSAEVAIVENVQRKDLTAIEEAKSYQALLDKGYMSQEELAKKMGLSQSAVSNKLRLLTLDESVQTAILEGKISERHARSLLKVHDHDKQKELLDKTINNRLTVKQLETEIKKITPTEEVIEPTSKPEETPIEPIVEVTKEKESPMKEDQINNPSPATSLDSFFSEPEKMPNKFFNFLEDSAANMNLEESTPNIVADNTLQANLIDNVDDIEMLDDFDINNSNNSEEDYLTKVINQIRSLDFDTSMVSIKEMNLPGEYRIDISIKKDINDKK